MKVSVGMDIGSFNSTSAVTTVEADEIDPEDVEMVPSKEGTTALEKMYGKSVPSFIRFDKAGNFVDAGINAKKESDNPNYITIWGVKGAVGRSYDELMHQEVTLEGLPSASTSGNAVSSIDENKIIPFLDLITYKELKTKDGKEKKPYIKIGLREYTPEEVYSFLIRKVKEDTEHYLQEEYGIDEPVTAATITVPADFNSNKRHGTMEAAKKAGIEKIELISEPTAACISYGIESESEPLIVVFDIGAGTTDVTLGQVVQIDGKPQFDQLHTKGNSNFGGLAIDKSFARAIQQKFIQEKDTNYDLNQELGFLRKVEEAKIFLSNEDEFKFSIAYGDGETWNTTLTREDLEKSIINDIENECIAPLRELLNKEKYGYGPEDIDEVLLVGGPVHMPVIRDAVINEFQNNPKVVEKLEIFSWKRAVDPMECVAKGAAINSAMGGHGGMKTTSQNYVILASRDLKDRDKHYLGFELLDVISEGTNIPLEKSVELEGHIKTIVIATLSAYEKTGKLECNAFWDIPVDVSLENRILLNFNLDSNDIMSVSVDTDHPKFKGPVIYENLTPKIGPLNLVEETRRENEDMINKYFSPIFDNALNSNMSTLKARIIPNMWPEVEGCINKYREGRREMENGLHDLKSLPESASGEEKLKIIKKVLDAGTEAMFNSSLVGSALIQCGLAGGIDSGSDVNATNRDNKQYYGQ